jgi:hypothetical protein
VIAHDRDANPGLVRIGDAADRGASRHQIGVVKLQKWGREAYLSGPFDPSKPHVARADPEAFHDRRRSRISDQLDLNPETRRKCLSDLYSYSPRPNPAYFSGDWILGVQSEMQSDPNSSGLDDVRNPRVGGLLRFGNGTSKLSEREE